MKKIVLALLVIWHVAYAPPVTKEKDGENEQNENEIGGLEDYMEYHRYLREVVNALESDPEFRKKLEKADESDIKSGKIAEELEFVSHHVRTRLDEIKRIELERLKELVAKKKQIEQQQNENTNSHGHLDHSNPHTFEIEDLKKLIAKATQDLAEADKKRREEFKEYELQKEYEKQKKLNETNGLEREKLEKEYRERENKHRKHEKLHEPGHKAQLEEVWEEQDQMQQDFDPKTFFMLHDIDGNGLWDQDEVKALFIKELDKMYQAGAPEDDMRERAEEMERMRESVYREVDTNQDGFIDFQEFLAQTKRNEFQQDHGWQGLDEQKPYTNEELAEYIRQHHAQQMAQAQAYYPVPPGYQNHPGQAPYQISPNMHGQMPNLNTNEVYHGQGNYPPMQQNMNQYHQQPPPQAYHPNQQYQPHSNQYQVPPNQNFNQVPQQQYQQQNQIHNQHPQQQIQQPQQQHQSQSPQQQQQSQSPQQQQQIQQPQQQIQMPQQQIQQPQQQIQQPQQQIQQPQQQIQQPHQQIQQPQQQIQQPQQQIQHPQQQQIQQPQQQIQQPQQQIQQPQQQDQKSLNKESPQVNMV